MGFQLFGERGSAASGELGEGLCGPDMEAELCVLRMREGEEGGDVRGLLS